MVGLLAGVIEDKIIDSKPTTTISGWGHLQIIKNFLMFQSLLFFNLFINLDKGILIHYLKKYLP